MKMMKNTLVLLLLHSASAASAQNPALESWLAGGDPLPALNQPRRTRRLCPCATGSPTA